MNEYIQYLDYSIEQWVEDADFIKWLKEPTNEKYAVFTRLRRLEPAVAANMEAAAQILFDIIVDEPALSDQEVTKIWDEIQLHTTMKNKLQLKRWTWVVSAAASVLVLFSISLYWYSGLVNTPSLIEYSNSISLDTIQKITLKIGQKPAMMLSNKAEVSFKANNSIVIRTASGDELSLNNIELSEKELAWLVVPRGSRASVVFADGSRAIVRPGTKIVFPTAFADTKREIFVEGEAFLEVSKNKSKPFMVKTNQMEVEVLGTSFDVQAYPTQNIQSVVLVTGSVKVRTIENRATQISPNQKFIYRKESHTELVKEVDVYDYISWKDGVLSFESEKLTTVLAKLSSYYPVDFKYNPAAIEQINLSGKLNLNDNIEDVMHVLSSVANIKHETINTNIIKIEVKQ